MNEQEKSCNQNCMFFFSIAGVFIHEV